MRIRTSKIWAVVVSLLALALLAAACGDDDDGAAPSTTAPASDTAPPDDDAVDDEPVDDDAVGDEPVDDAVVDDEPAGDDAVVSEPREEVELRFWLWDINQVNSTELLIAAFQEENPHIKIEIEQTPFGEYWPAVQTAIAGGDPPDIMWMSGPFFPSFAINESLLPLSDLIERDSVDMSAFPQAMIDLYSSDGVLYGIPKDYDTIVLFYRPDLFDAAGLDYPDETWTWDDTKAAAAALTTDDVWGFGAFSLGQPITFPLIHQNGGDIVSADGERILYDEPAACETFQYLYSFQQEGTAPPQSVVDASNPWEMFPNGQLAMIPMISAFAKPWSELDIAVNIAPLPAGKERATIIHGLSWTILAGTDHPEEAWEFLKFLATEEAHLIQAGTGEALSAYAGTEDAWLADLEDALDAHHIIEGTEYAQPFPLANGPLNWDYEVTAAIIDDAFRGNLEFPEACEMAAEAANQYIADNHFSS